MLPAWFEEARFGIFIHWGIYSRGDGSESWAFYNGQTPYDEYMAQAADFTAERYDPEAWAELFQKAGARYAVLTAKHHDGFALWDTEQSRLNAVEGSPAGRDLIGPYVQALRRHGLKVGLYFSHLDWSHPDYASVRPSSNPQNLPGDRFSNPFGYPQGPDEPERWRRFLEFHRAQLLELMERYRPDLLWFDGDWERDDEQWGFREMREWIRSVLPEAVVNSRMGEYGDYATPEQGMPVRPPSRPWEFCVTINDSWGYQRRDANHKSVRQCLRMLVECAGMGGNLLLDVGPKSDGSLQPEQAAVLAGMGRWMARHGEAITGTRAGLPPGHHYGPSTLSADGRTLYLFLLDDPKEGVGVKGVRNAVRQTRIVGGPEVPSRRIGGADWADIPGELWIEVPRDALDPDVTVVAFELEGELNLYAGAGRT